MEITGVLKSVQLKGGNAVIQLEAATNGKVFDIAKHVDKEIVVVFEPTQLTLDRETGEVC